jgi:hypothetical protein
MKRIEVPRSRAALLSCACALALIASVAAGCGSTKSRSATPRVAMSAGSASNASAHRLAGIKYAHCMRAHGVDVVDPDQNGNIQVDAPNTPKVVVDRANQACQKLRIAALGVGMTAAQHAQALKQMTNFARCMRAHHIPMADPFTGPNGGVGFSVPPGISPSSRRYTTAEAACKHYLPNGG